MTLGTYPAMTLADARDAWREARKEVQAGRDPAKRKDRVGTTDFEGIFEEWLRRDQANNKSKAVVARTIERDVLPLWDGRHVGDIGRRDVLDVIDAVVDRGSPVMARRLQANLHRLFKWAVGRGIIEINPVSNLPKPGSEIRPRPCADGWRGCCCVERICAARLASWRRYPVVDSHWCAKGGSWAIALVRDR